MWCITSWLHNYILHGLYYTIKKIWCKFEKLILRVWNCGVKIKIFINIRDQLCKNKKFPIRSVDPQDWDLGRGEASSANEAQEEAWSRWFHGGSGQRCGEDRNVTVDNNSVVAMEEMLSLDYRVQVNGKGYWISELGSRCHCFRRILKLIHYFYKVKLTLFQLEKKEMVKKMK